LEPTKTHVSNPFGSSELRAEQHRRLRARRRRHGEIPQRGGCKTPQRRAYERSPAFRQGQRFRAGMKGCISVLMRGRGMKRCRAEGAERFALFVGAAVLANNLIIIGELLTKRSRRRWMQFPRRRPISRIVLKQDSTLIAVIDEAAS
jgi:hypothetical protein